MTDLSISQKRVSRLLPRWVVIALILGAFAVYVHELDGQSLWRDEGLSVIRALQPLTRIFANRNIVDGVESPDLHPPLYFLMLHGWRFLAGESEFALRFPSLSAMLLALAVFYAAGKRIWGRESALWAAGLAAISPFFFWYAQEARMYTIVVLESALLLYTLWPLLGKSAGKGQYLYFSLVASLLVFTNYVGAFSVLSAVLIYLLVQLRGGVRWRVILAPLAIVVVALSFLYPHLRELLSRPDFLAFAPRPLWHLGLEVINTFSLGSTVPLAKPGWRLLPFLTLGALGVPAMGVRPVWRRRRALLIVVAGAFLPLLLFFAASWLKANYSNPRHLTILAAPWFLLMGHGLTTLHRRWWPLALLVGLAALVAGGSALYRTINDPPMVKDDVRSLAKYVRERMAPGDLLLWHDAVMMVAYDYYALDLPYEAAPRYGWGDEEEVIQRLSEQVPRHERIWFVESPAPAYFDENIVPGWLSERLVLTDSAVFPASWASLHLLLYEQPRTTKALPADAVKADLSIDGYHINGLIKDGIATAGEGVQLSLVWSADEFSEPPPSVCVRLLDSAAVSWTEGCTTLDWPDGGEPLNEMMLQRLWLKLPVGLAPIAYSVVLVAGEASQTVGELAVSPSPQPPLGDPLAAYDNGLQLSVVEWPADTFRAGLWALGNPIWHTNAPIEEDLIVSVRLVDWLGRNVVEKSFKLGPTDYPSEIWQPSDMVRSAFALRLPFESGGRYRAQLQVVGKDRKLLPTSGWLSGSWVDLGQVRVEKVPLIRQLPDDLPYRPEKLYLGESIRLAGYDLSRRGDQLIIKLYWWNGERVLEDYGVFVHVSEPGKAPVAQSNGGPANWTRPTTTWREGEIIEDLHTIKLPAGLVDTSMSVFAGMYEITDPDKRLAMTAAGEAVPGNAWKLGDLSSLGPDQP